MISIFLLLPFSLVNVSSFLCIGYIDLSDVYTLHRPTVH